MVLIIKKESSISFSIIPSFECNLTCPHCMYDAGPDRKEVLDIETVKGFLDKIDFDRIRAIGFYGGEISINLSLYEKYVSLVPEGIPKFTITNGVWPEPKRFVDFLLAFRMKAFISTTEYHQKYQDPELIQDYLNFHTDLFELKHDDLLEPLLPMGRASHLTRRCTRRCFKPRTETRYAMRPDGKVIFQNCDGIYPILSDEDIKEIFE